MGVRGVRRVALLVVGVVVGSTCAAVNGAPPALVSSSTPAVVTQSLSFATSSGVVLHATVGGYGSLAGRPLIVEDSPYSPDVRSLAWVGQDFNFLELQWRGTGLSQGSLDAAGPLDQSDLSQFLGWACNQPWSNGRLGLYGFSASAVVAYNAMHLPLPCVKAAALMAGTTDLYRDLLYIGGVLNSAAGAVVEATIGGTTLTGGATRVGTDPGSVPASAAGFFSTPIDVLGHPTEDGYWDQRAFQGDASHVPVLADTSFYDVEPSGPFAAFEATRRYGSHLLVCGAHDGFPTGTPGPFPQYLNWFEHYLVGQPLTPANQAVVSVCVGNGSREQFLAGDLTRVTAPGWPLAGTQWSSLYLSAASTGSVRSLNDGSLALQTPAGQVNQPYPFAPSPATETDLHNIATVAGSGLDQAAGMAPAITDMQLSDPTSLTYTSPPLTKALTAVGPGSVDVFMSSSQPVTDIYAVIADVWPNGTAYPVATGALRTAFPNVDAARSLVDAKGDIVDPFNLYSSQTPAPLGATREYHVEILPMGNTFAVGHRLRLYVLGTPFDQMPAPPGIDIVSLGGGTASRLLLPSLNGAPAFGS